MRHRKIHEAHQSFVDRVRKLERQLYPDQLSDEGPSFMESDGRRFWHFSPSHHIATGLLTEEDVAFLSLPGKRLLSVGAHPAFLECLLVELGVPARNILLADKDPSISSVESLQSVIFDANELWPYIDAFDRIIFPESLCIAIGDRIRQMGIVEKGASKLHPTDEFEAKLLAALMGQALRRLRSGGMIRANGPMSHPNVIAAMCAELRKEGFVFDIDSQRFFLSIRN